MLQRLQKKWGVSGAQLFWILLVFAITGTTTAFLTKVITGWVGFDNDTFWLYKVLLRLGMLLIGYQLILLTVAAILGQFSFFWAYEKKILRWIGWLPKVPAMETKVQQIAVFASGSGSNARKIIDRFKTHPSIKVALVVCNKVEAGVVLIAQEHGIPYLIIDRERFFRGDGYLPIFKEHRVSFIVLAGFLWKIPEAILSHFKGSIVNIHPALLPKFGGKGMYGHHVHAAVIEAGETESGITIHYVDEDYDHGAAIFQATCPVYPTDTPNTLAQRVLSLEHSHYPQVIEEVITQKTFV